MAIEPFRLRPTPVQLDGPGPFETPHPIAVPYLAAPEAGSPTRVCLIVEPGKELRIPMDDDYKRSLWELLGKALGLRTTKED